MKSQCLHHDKFRDLHKLIGAQSTAHTAGYLELLWAHASQVKCGPIFERHRIEKVADWIGEEGVLLNALIQVRFFDVLEDDCVAIHDWLEHCPEFVKKRDYQKFHMRDKRKKLDVVSPNISHVSTMLGTVSPPTNTNLTYTNQYKEENTDTCAKSRTTPPEIQEVMDYWNSKKELTAAKKVTEKRIKAIKAILKDESCRDIWRESIDHVTQSDHHIGKNDRGWKIDFDWWCKVDKVVKFAEMQPAIRMNKYGIVLKQEEESCGFVNPDGTPYVSR